MSLVISNSSGTRKYAGMTLKTYMINNYLCYKDSDGTAKYLMARPRSTTRIGSVKADPLTYFYYGTASGTGPKLYFSKNNTDYLVCDHVTRDTRLDLSYSITVKYSLGGGSYPGGWAGTAAISSFKITTKASGVTYYARCGLQLGVSEYVNWGKTTTISSTATSISLQSYSYSLSANPNSMVVYFKVSSKSNFPETSDFTSMYAIASTTTGAGEKTWTGTQAIQIYTNEDETIY